jgi:hypothetical protein
MFKAPPEWAEKKRARMIEEQRKARQARNNQARQQHLAETEKREAARLARLNRMASIRKPVDEAADGADLP